MQEPRGDVKPARTLENRGAEDERDGSRKAEGQMGSRGGILGSILSMVSFFLKPLISSPFYTTTSLWAVRLSIRFTHFPEGNLDIWQVLTTLT